MVLDGNTGKILGVITDTPNNHGIALAKKSNHGFITNRGDSTVTMFDLTTLATIKKIKIPAGGQDGIMYDDFTDRGRMSKVFRSDLFFKHQVKYELRLAKNLPHIKALGRDLRSSRLPPLPERHNSPQGFAEEGLDS